MTEYMREKLDSASWRHSQNHPFGPSLIWNEDEGVRKGSYLRVACSQSNQIGTDQMGIANSLYNQKKTALFSSV